jgi:hypothetical protein
MTSRPNPPDRPLRAKLRELGLLSREQEAGLPQFLILAPEYPGARRLAQILQCHPGCSLPDALGTRFFSSRHQCCDLDWYIRTLGNDVHLVRGEWTPSYALVPLKTIRLIQELLPQLKLVFLLRDPAIEAWHAWNESKPMGNAPGIVAETWPWARADSLGQLRRWTSVFSRDQFFIGFDEELRTDQGAFLKRLFAFLGVEQLLPQQHGEPRPGSTELMPDGELAVLREACRSRIEELAAFLRDDFGLDAPAYWTAPPATKIDFAEVVQPAQTFSSVVQHEFDDVYLFRAVARDEAHSQCSLRTPTVPTQVPPQVDSRAASFARDRLPARGDAVPRLVCEGHRGFNIVAFRQDFIAIPQAAGVIDLSRMRDAALEQKVNAREFLRASSLAGAEQAIHEYLVAVESAVLENGFTPHGVEQPPRSAA